MQAPRRLKASRAPQVPGCCWRRARVPAGRPKALVELDGCGWLTAASRCCGRAAPTRWWWSPARPRSSLPGVITVHNPDWRTGMGSSLAAGLRSVPRCPAAAVIALVDQPLVGAAAVQRLIGAHAAGAGVAVAAYDGQPRNPVLIAREHWPEVIAWPRGTSGARPFLRAHPELVTLVECADTGRPDDIDTPADLARLTGLLPRQLTVTSIPQVCVTLSPGSSMSRSSRRRTRWAGRSSARWPARGGPRPAPAGRR